jgi:hypothetical protein
VRDCLCGLVVRVLGYRSGGPGSIPSTTKKKKVVGLERGPLSLVSTTEEILERKSSGSGLENQEYGHRDPLRWPCGTLYLKKLAIASLTSGSRSISIVCSRTQTMEFFFSFARMIFLFQFEELEKKNLWTRNLFTGSIFSSIIQMALATLLQCTFIAFDIRHWYPIQEGCSGEMHILMTGWVVAEYEYTVGSSECGITFWRYVVLQFNSRNGPVKEKFACLCTSGRCPLCLLVELCNSWNGGPLLETKTNSMTWVREWTIPTERPPLVGEVITNFLRLEGATWSAWWIPTSVFLVF